MWNAESTVVVVNPNAAGGRVGKKWPDLERELKMRLGGVAFRLTERPHHEARAEGPVALAPQQVAVPVAGGDDRAEPSPSLW